MKRLVDIGTINQLAFVPADYEGTLNFWIGTMGAGPFFELSHSKAEWTTHRGQPIDPDLTIALGHWDDMQIEIIRQHNDAPSPYREWRQGGGEGLHHVCIAAADIAVARAQFTAAGANVLYRGGGNGAEWFYAETGGGPGSIVEVIQHSPASQALMDMVRNAARGWDGSNPLRRIG